MSSEQGAREILRHIARHGVADKDALHGGRSGRPRQRRSGPRNQTTLDLHGLTEERAAAALREAVAAARRNGVRSLLVVHGRGIHSDPAEGAVLQRLVRIMLAGELQAFVRDSRSAASAQGGDGATLVYLR
jgi:DNA-nicking Smr family endonuclease